MRFLVTLALFLLTTSPALASDFCAGFKHGYETGHKQATGSNLPPLAPLCPLQPLKGLSDPQSDYEHGYLIGLQTATREGASAPRNKTSGASPADVANAYIAGRAAGQQEKMRRLQIEAYQQQLQVAEGAKRAKTEKARKASIVHFEGLLAEQYPDAAKKPGFEARYVEKLRQAASQGDPAAQNALGFIYDVGWQVPQDYKEAVKWYEKSAEQDHANAQANLGRMYANGDGVKVDRVRAYMWLNLAASKAQEGAASTRDTVASYMTPKQIAKAQKRSRKWKPKD